MRRFFEMLNTPIAFLVVVLVLVVVVNSILYFGYYLPRTSENSPAGGGSPVVVGAGDIADCSNANDEATADLLDDIDGTVLTLGDNAYYRGTTENFRECYDPTWGRHKPRTRPVPGNHEYLTPGAQGYYDYFGDAAGDPDEGYYSYNLGEWHVVALNSNCEEVGGCSPRSPQVRWLKENLADNEKGCTLAYFHHPLFTSGRHRPGSPKVRPMWEALYAANADVVLNGHDHNYQRFAPQDPEGSADPQRGIREFVVGTGGKSLYAIETPIDNSEAYNDNTFGVIKLTLRPGSYAWEFVSAGDKTFTDSGRDQCH